MGASRTQAASASSGHRINMENAGHAHVIIRILQGANANAADMIQEYWKASILSGPVTLTTNATGFLNIMGHLLFQAPMEALINDLILKHPDKPHLAEMKYVWAGLSKGFARAWSKAWLAQKAEMDLHSVEHLDQVMEIDELREKGAGRAALSEQLFLQILGRAHWPKYRKAKEQAFANLASRTDLTVEEKARLAEQAARKALENTFAAKVQNAADKTGVSQVLRGSRIRLSFRASLFFDQLYRYIFGEALAGGHAYRIAKKEGKTGQALTDRIAELTAEMGSEAWGRTVEQLNELSGTNKLNKFSEGGGFIEHMAYRVQQKRNARAAELPDKIEGLVWNFTIPFVVTVFRLVQSGMRKTPLGTAGALWHHGVRAGLIDQFSPWGDRSRALLEADENGKWHLTDATKARLVRDGADVIWMAALTALAFAAAEGDGEDDDRKLVLITGSHPRGVESKGEKQLAERLYGSPQMIRVFGKWFDYSKIEPLATMLSLSVDAVRSMKGKMRGATTEETLNTLTGYYRSQGTDKSFFKGLSDLNDIVAEATSEKGKPIEAVGKMGGNIMKGFLPNIIAQPQRNIRDEQTVWGQSRAKRDIYGRPIVKQYSGSGWKIVRALVDTGIDPQPVQEEFDLFLREYQTRQLEWPDGVSFPSAKESYYTLKQREPIEMTEAEQDEFDREAGERFSRESRARLSPSDLNRPTPEKLREVIGLLHRIREQTRYEMFPSQRAYERLSTQAKDRLPMQAAAR